MTKNMLIDASHPEETRVVVEEDGNLTEFDFESSTKRQIKGNVYLAKITRVEPSLQAAFVEYGGNRHGFLAFSEIHPDYYQIPQADREFLDNLTEACEDEPLADTPDNEDTIFAVPPSEEEETAEVVDEQARKRARLLRSYKIQEVIKRRQILLVQVVKEERGNKGAALTTYLSLAGRYCVLMPNTPRGGGISRKIASANDRRRLKAIAHDLDVPQGMGLIVRTAGQQRNKSEIKRDYDYLLRLWEQIRATTLESIAPTLIYEEGDLVKRALRDLYTRDIEEVLVEGEETYKSAKKLMAMLMPSRARTVKQFKSELPLFVEVGVEDQLDVMFSPHVGLPSGGSIVIHVTEALTAIDVNSGRSTKERHIDETALKTNVEAAEEIARQLRLRDIAGLIVIDFIDMNENRHQRQVERKLRDALKNDRARLQTGKISMFGLLELSRQRLRPSLQELSSHMCPHCNGQGTVRSVESCALQALRQIQDHGLGRKIAALNVRLPIDVALYLLNSKRDILVRLEERFSMRILILADDKLQVPAMGFDVVEKRESSEEDQEPLTDNESQEQKTGAPKSALAVPSDSSDDPDGRKKRRRRRRRRRNDVGENSTSETIAAHIEEPSVEESEQALIQDDEDIAVLSETSDEIGTDNLDLDDPKKAVKSRRRRARRPRKSSAELNGDQPSPAVWDNEAADNASLDPADSTNPEDQQVEGLTDGSIIHQHGGSTVSSDIEEKATEAEQSSASDASTDVKERDASVNLVDFADDLISTPQNEAENRTLSENSKPPQSDPSQNDSPGDKVSVEPELVGDQQDSGPAKRGWWNRFVR